MSQQKEASPSFDRDRHVVYFTRCLRQLPGAYSSLDTSRLTLAHFCVQALNLLGALPQDRESIVEWIYTLQVDGGFVGGNSTCSAAEYNYPHIAMTYTALCTLQTLGDDLSRVDKEGIVQHLKLLQRSDGSFQCIRVGSEYDMRFLYCACAVSFLLNDWSGVDMDRAVEYIVQCHSFDGAIALIPNQEGHGGSTFCGVASLRLMDRLDVLEERNWKGSLVQWCASRQVGGMQGRPNKDEDTCYSYWIGATLRLLDENNLLEHNLLRAYVLSCQHGRFGGFGKVYQANPDVLHSFYSLAYLSMSSDCFSPEEKEQLGLKELNCTLGVGKLQQDHDFSAT